MWWLKAKANFEYDSKTFMWKVTISDDDNPFTERWPSGKFGKSEHWLLPVAYAEAVGEYYGFIKH